MWTSLWLRRSRLLAPILIACQVGTLACFTPAVHRRWQGQGRVRAVSVTLLSASADWIEAEWQVTADDGLASKTRLAVDPKLAPCSSVDVAVPETGQVLRRDEAAVVPPSAELEPGSRPLPAACAVEMRRSAPAGGAVAIAAWTSQGKLAEITAPTPRRDAWLWAHPPAALGDLLLFTVGAVFVLGWVIIESEIEDRAEACKDSNRC